MAQMTESIDDVIHRYRDMVYRLAFARMGTKYDADEVFQEVFVRYLDKRPKFRDEEHRKAWMIRVTVNCCNKLWNSSWRRKTEALQENLVWETPEDNDLYCTLQQLPMKYREVIHLFYYEDMSTAQIAKILHRKESTVRTQLTRARTKLREILKEEDYV
ncbi:MAG: sigma-70 family RNA polymerase sigma factor [Eubacteriales bacterium]|nr:sigma-70 family RNA polymerase sigma factor [Eubacteriales bacterium]